MADADLFVEEGKSSQNLGPEHGAANPSDSPPPYQPGYGTTDNAPPPTYTPSADPSDQPPSYDSIFGQVRAAKQQSSGIVQFLKQLIIIVLGTIGCTICIGLVLAIPISMIVMGAHYKDDCPAEKYIPIYLIVGGVFGVLKNLLNILQRAKNRKENQDDENAKSNPVDGVLNCFLMAWFIAGNVWVYRTYGNFQDERPGEEDFCNATLYWYAFWMTTVTYIIMGTVCFCICCAGMVAALAGNDK